MRVPAFAAARRQAASERSRKLGRKTGPAPGALAGQGNLEGRASMSAPWLYPWARGDRSSCKLNLRQGQRHELKNGFGAAGACLILERTDSGPWTAVVDAKSGIRDLDLDLMIEKMHPGAALPMADRTATTRGSRL